MKVNLFKYPLLLCVVCWSCAASAQANWTSKGPLYADKNITVEIEYALGNNPCSPGQAPSQFRYKITKLKRAGAYYINWRFDYFNCDHQLKTYVTSLPINDNTKLGDFVPKENTFFALKLANYFNEVKKSPGLPAAVSYIPTSSNSLAPKAITGQLMITQGKTTLLSLLGGYLAPNTTWRWYEGDYNGRFIGSGASIQVRPGQTTTYSVRGEGDSPTACISTTVTVPDANVAATGIAGKAQICAGEKDVRLMVTGGKLVAGAKWVWYQGSCGGVPIGEGDHIYVSPLSTTSYAVRAEGTGGTSPCQTHQLVVILKSKAAVGIDGVARATRGEPFTLAVQGGELAADAHWVWYSGTNADKVRLGQGSSFTIAAADADQTYYVRAEGTCFNTEFVAKAVRVSTRAVSGKRAAADKPAIFFINGGVVASDVSQLAKLNNYVVTMGGGKHTGWLLRARISSEQASSVYETTGTQILNYDRAGYYQYNSQIASKRTAYTGGIYLGGDHLAVYIGCGYGTRELLYGINQYSYGSPFSTQTAWVKYTAASFAGAEIEGGLLLKASYFNLMGGVSTIQGKYTDYNLGIGFNF